MAIERLFEIAGVIVYCDAATRCSAIGVFATDAEYCAGLRRARCKGVIARVLRDYRERAEFVLFSLSGNATSTPLTWLVAFRGDRVGVTLRPGGGS